MKDRACFICQRPESAHKQSLLAEASDDRILILRCRAIRDAIWRLRRAMIDARNCRFGDGRPREPGRTVCDFHLILKASCADCGGPILRQEGRGRQPAHCDACDLKRRPSKRRTRPEALGQEA